MHVSSFTIKNIGLIENDTRYLSNITTFIGKNYVGKTTLGVDIVPLCLYGHAPSKDCDIYTMITTGQDNAYIEMDFEHKGDNWKVTRTARTGIKTKEQDLSIIVNDIERNPSLATTRGQVIIDTSIANYKQFCIGCVLLPNHRHDLLVARSAERRDFLVDLIPNKDKIEEENETYKESIKTIKNAIYHLEQTTDGNVEEATQNLLTATATLEKAATLFNNAKKADKDLISKKASLESHKISLTNALIESGNSLKQLKASASMYPDRNDLQQVDIRLDMLTEKGLYITDNIEDIPYISNCDTCPLYKAYSKRVASVPNAKTTIEIARDFVSRINIAPNLAAPTKVKSMLKTLDAIDNCRQKRSTINSQLEDVNIELNELGNIESNLEEEKQYTQALRKQSQAESSLAEENKKREEYNKAQNELASKRKSLAQLENLEEATSKKGILLSDLINMLTTIEELSTEISNNIIEDEKIDITWELGKSSGKDAVIVKVNERDASTYSGSQLKTMRLATKIAISQMLEIDLIEVDELPDSLDENHLRKYINATKNLSNLQVLTTTCNKKVLDLYDNTSIEHVH